MFIFFRDFGTEIEEVDARHEVLDDPLLADPLAVLRELPAVELQQLGFGLRQRGRRRVFAREAFLLDQFSG
jgi:hypothetical protein